ncbi:MAG: O-antigen ligase family protein [Gallionella sp.]|nr:O-antigen ligase family protein [Gallionella sp.]MDP1939494.1 O-antigen ligase family protein [Gallionella sp.]
MRPATGLHDGSIDGLQRTALSSLRASTILLGFTVPISVALDNVLLAVLLLGLLFNARAVWQIATQHPVARAACLLFVVLFSAIFYGATPLREAAGALGKYIDLVFIPMFMLMLSNEVLRHRAQGAFLVAMGLTLLLSYLVGLHGLPVQSWMNVVASPDNPVIFHSHITQNNMMAFAVFLALLNLRDSATRAVQWAWGLFAVLAGINVLFMVQGRTGYIILLVLLGWFAWTTLARYMRERGSAWGWRQGAALMLLLVGLVAATYSASPRLHDRVNLIFSEFQAWQPNHGKDTSTGQRLDFYYNSLKIVQQQPFFGVGTGGFAAAFASQTQGTEVLQTPNPHNEYLMITTQSGLIGLAMLLYLFYTLWRYAPLLGTVFEQDAARGLVLAYMVNGAFNSALHDHADGLFFAFMAAVLFAGLKPVQRAVEEVA